MLTRPSRNRSTLLAASKDCAMRVECEAKESNITRYIAIGMKPEILGPPPFPHFGRGDFKLFLLRVLGTQPMHGYEIMKFIEERSHGFYKPSAGSIYPSLRSLVKRGLAAVAGGNGRNVYRITTKGKAYLRRQGAEFEKRFKSFEERIGPERAALFREARSIGKLFRHGLGTITPAQAKKLRMVLVETKERIMTIITE